MTLPPQQVLQWCRSLLTQDGENRSLEEYLEAIPSVAQLGDLPSGTRVLVRGDVDAGIEDEVVVDDSRLRSMLETLRFGIEHGWVQIVFGHRGRDPELSLRPVQECLQDLLDCSVEFIPEWLDDERGTILDAAAEKVATVRSGAIILLENTRRYSLERALWKAKEDDLPALADRLTRFLGDLREKVACVHVNEALAASNPDVSSVVVPAGMDRVALGFYLDREMRQHVTRAREAQLVVFSGLKIEKLSDLENVLHRGKVRMVLSAGSLAMALKKAEAELDGESFEMGKAGDPRWSKEKYHIPPERVEQARRMIGQGRRQGVEFVLPVDFVLADGSVVGQIPPDGQQLDVGPKTIQLFEQKIGQFIQWHRQHRLGGTGSSSTSAPTSRVDKPPVPPAETGQPAVVFHNGVFGKFEDPRFENGTREFMKQLKRLHDAGVEVYVGGGEGGAAIEKYGQPDWVTHVFTAGGTILKAIGTEPIPYLKALWMAVEARRASAR